MMMISTLSMSLAVVPVAFGFHVLPTQRQGAKPTSLFTMKDDGIENNSFATLESGPDMERAKECAEHFGKCSVKELQKLKSELHQKRIQNLVFRDADTAPEEAFQERLIEQELDMQLNLLQDEFPPAYLFPEVEEPMEQLPHLKDGTVAAKVQVEEQTHVIEEMVEEMAEEGVFDSLAICALIGVLMLAPQFLLQ